MSAIAFVLVACVCFTCLDTTAKTVLPFVPVMMVMWVRYMVQAVLSTAILWPAQGRALWRTKHLGLQILRGAALMASSILGLNGLKHMPVGEFTAIVMVTPLAVTLYAAIKQRQQISLWRWAAVLGGFIGVLLILQPGASEFRWAWLFPLGVVGTSVLFQMLTSLVTRHDNASTTHFFTGWVITGMATLALPFVWANVVEPALWWGMAALGVLGGIGHYMFTLAFARAPAAVITPYQYAQIGMAALLGWLVLGQLPNTLSMLGMVLIVISGVACAWLARRSA